MTIQQLRPGSTIILSTTSPDKKDEYQKIFEKYDINFFILEDFKDESGQRLSPQKTNEMKNSYTNNMLEKAAEMSLALHSNQSLIREQLIEAGVYKYKDFMDVNGNQKSDAPQIVGMVEDSGIRFIRKTKQSVKSLHEYLKIFSKNISFKI